MVRPSSQAAGLTLVSGADQLAQRFGIARETAARTHAWLATWYQCQVLAWSSRLLTAGRRMPLGRLADDAEAELRLAQDRVAESAAVIERGLADANLRRSERFTWPLLVIGAQESSHIIIRGMESHDPGSACLNAAEGMMGTWARAGMSLGS